MVEHNLAKVGVASSSLVSRSNFNKVLQVRALLPQMLKACGNSSVVEHNLAKVGVASSSLVSRSNFNKVLQVRALLPQMLKACGNSSVVEHNLAKVGVASSSLVSRSNFSVSWINPQSSGWVAEWSCTGLQIRVPRFDSGLSLHKFNRIPSNLSNLIQKITF